MIIQNIDMAFSSLIITFLMQKYKKEYLLIIFNNNMTQKKGKS